MAFLFRLGMHSWKPPVTFSYYSSVCTTECSWNTIWIPSGLHKIEIRGLGALPMHQKHKQDPVPGSQARNSPSRTETPEICTVMSGSQHFIRSTNPHYLLDIAGHRLSIFNASYSFFPRQQGLPN